MKDTFVRTREGCVKLSLIVSKSAKAQEIRYNCARKLSSSSSNMNKVGVFPRSGTATSTRIASSSSRAVRSRSRSGK